MASQKQVLASLQNDKLEQALQQCKQWISQEPGNPDALQWMGLVSAKLQYIPQAIQYFQQALAINPHLPECHNNLSNAYKSLGQIEPAYQHLHAALNLNPSYAQGYSNLGALYYSEGRYQQAIDALKKAIRLQPNYWEAHFNLAHSYAQQNQMSLAKQHYATVLKFQPEHPVACLNYGLCLIELAEYEEAIPYLEKGLASDQRNAPAFYELANAYLEMGNAEQAKAIFYQCLSIDPKYPSAHHNLGVIFARERNSQEALHHFKIALEQQPDNPTALHMVAALSGEQRNDAPQGYVKQLFDQYAGFYNRHVKDQLNYQVPSKLRELFSEHVSPKFSGQQVLDIGCGTGLSALQFRDIAHYLVGVDLSHAMLAHSQQLGAYDALVCANVQQLLPGLEQNCFDLVIAADVLVYCGDLSKIFTLVKSCLKSDGYFIFSTEQAEQNFYLKSTARFGHATSYVISLAEQFKFNVVVQKEDVLRFDQKNQIIGNYYILKNNI